MGATHHRHTIPPHHVLRGHGPAKFCEPRPMRSSAAPCRHSPLSTAKTTALCRDDQLPAQSRARRHLLLHGQPARPQKRPSCPAHPQSARRRSARQGPGTFPHRCLGGPAGAHALRLDIAGRRHRLLQPMGNDQGAFSKSLPTGETRSASRTGKGERGIWQRRFWEHTIRDDCDYAGPCRLCSFQPGEARPCVRVTRLALHVISPRSRTRHLSGIMGGRDDGHVSEAGEREVYDARSGVEIELRHGSRRQPLRVRTDGFDHVGRLARHCWPSRRPGARPSSGPPAPRLSSHTSSWSLPKCGTTGSVARWPLRCPGRRRAT